MANLLRLRIGGVCVPGTSESERIAANRSTSSAGNKTEIDQLTLTASANAAGENDVMASSLILTPTALHIRPVKGKEDMHQQNESMITIYFMYTFIFHQREIKSKKYNLELVLNTVQLLPHISLLLCFFINCASLSTGECGF